MSKFNIFYSPQFEKGRERARKRGLDVAKLDEVVAILASGEVPPPRLSDHPLKGRWIGCRECHIGGPKSDWVLVYQKFAEKLLLYLIKTGKHREVKVGD